MVNLTPKTSIVRRCPRNIQKTTPVTKVSGTSKEDFVVFLWNLLNGRTTDWKTVRTAEDARVRHQAVLDAMNELEDLGWAKTGGVRNTKPETQGIALGQ